MIEKCDAFFPYFLLLYFLLLEIVQMIHLHNFLSLKKLNNIILFIETLIRIFMSNFCICIFSFKLLIFESISDILFFISINFIFLFSDFPIKYLNYFNF